MIRDHEKTLTALQAERDYYERVVNDSRSNDRRQRAVRRLDQIKVEIAKRESRGERV